MNRLYDHRDIVSGVMSARIVHVSRQCRARGGAAPGRRAGCRLRARQGAATWAAKRAIAPSPGKRGAAASAAGRGVAAQAREK